MSRLGFLAALSALLALSGAAPAAPAHYGNPGGYRAGYTSGYHPNYNGYSGYRAGYSGYYRPGNSLYYPGYFGNQYRSGYPAVGIGFYSSAYAYPAPAAIYGAPGSASVIPDAPDAGAPPPVPTDGAASVGVHVPPDADVWFNGDATQQKGELREFVTPPLPSDHDFQYDVRARWTENGKPVDQSRTITVRANQRTEVDFTQPEPLKAPRLAPVPK